MLYPPLFRRVRYTTLEPSSSHPPQYSQRTNGGSGLMKRKAEASAYRRSEGDDPSHGVTLLQDPVRADESSPSATDVSRSVASSSSRSVSCGSFCSSFLGGSSFSAIFFASIL